GSSRSVRRAALAGLPILGRGAALLLVRRRHHVEAHRPTLRHDGMAVGRAAVLLPPIPEPAILGARGARRAVRARGRMLRGRGRVTRRWTHADRPAHPPRTRLAARATGPVARDR